jgi:ABC-type phosphate transport system permease subunit
MTTDPIISQFVMALRRILIFIVLSILIALFVWSWLLKSKFGVHNKELLDWMSVAWPPEENKIAAVFLYGSLTIGILMTTIIYLWIGRWWNKRANVTQHRGARIDNMKV